MAFSFIKTIKIYNLKRKLLYKKYKLLIQYSPLFLLDKIFARNKPVFLPKEGKILLIFNNMIGDTVVCSSLIRNLSQLGYEIYVSSRQQSLDLLQYNPYVKGTFLFNDKNIICLLRSILSLRKQSFSLAIDVRVSRKPIYNDFLYYALVKSPILIGCNKQMFKTFNISVSCKLSTVHVIEPLRKILEIFDKETIRRNMSYDLFIPETVENCILQQIEEKDFIVFNPLGSKDTHCLSSKQAHAIYQLLISSGSPVFIIGESKKLYNLSFKKEEIFYSKTIIDIIPLIKKAKLIVSVDTSIVHIASAFNKDTISIYPKPSYFKLPKKPTSDLELINFNYWLFDTQMRYGLYNIPANELNNFFSVSTVFWHPNNYNAIQITLNSYYISNTDTTDLINKITPKLRYFLIRSSSF